MFDVLSLCPSLTSQCSSLGHLLEFLPRPLLLLESHELLGSERSLVRGRQEDVIVDGFRVILP